MDIIKILLCFRADPLLKNNEGVSIYDLYEKSYKKSTNLFIGTNFRLCIDQLRK